MLFNAGTLETRHNFGMMVKMFKKRKIILANKQKHLRDLWHREVEIMIAACQQKAKTKKYKILHTKLTQFNDIKTETFLNEYYRMCVALYLIKAQIHQCWVKSHKTEELV